MEGPFVLDSTSLAGKKSIRSALRAPVGTTEKSYAVALPCDGGGNVYQNAGFFPASAAAKLSGFRAESGVRAVMAASSFTPITGLNRLVCGSKA